MAFKRKTNFSDCPTIKIGGKNEDGSPRPKQVEGYFLGTKITPDTGYGEGKLHFFQTEEGVVGVWGKTMMNSALTSELIGVMTRVTFTGLGKKVKGKNPAMLFDIEYDEENRLSDSSLAGLSVSSGAADQGSEPEETEELVEDTDAEEEEEAPAPVRALPPKRAATAPSAEQQAKVKAMLAGKRPA